MLIVSGTEIQCKPVRLSYEGWDGFVACFENSDACRYEAEVSFLILDDWNKVQVAIEGERKYRIQCSWKGVVPSKCR